MALPDGKPSVAAGMIDQRFMQRLLVGAKKNRQQADGILTRIVGKFRVQDVGAGGDEMGGGGTRNIAR